MDKRAKIAEQLKQIENLDSGSDTVLFLSYGQFDALLSAIDELKKNCSNCRFSKIYDFEKDDGKKFGECEKATQPLPDDSYFVGYLSALEVTPDHFCGFHEPKDKL